MFSIVLTSSVKSKRSHNFMQQREPKILRLVLMFLPSAEEDGHDEYDGDHPLQYYQIRGQYSGHVICNSQSEASIQVT